MASLPGLYRALVVDAADPQRLNRLRVSVPAVAGFGERWALPCRPAGSRAVPKAGSTVWIAFEGGDPDQPVWVGVLR